MVHTVGKFLPALLQRHISAIGYNDVCKSLGWVQCSPVDCLPRGNHLCQLEGIVLHIMFRVANGDAAQAWRHDIAVFCVRDALSCKYHLSVVLCMERLHAVMTIA